MASTSPVFIFDQSCGDAVNQVIQELTGAGLQALRTFDFQPAQNMLSECACPPHESAACDCQMAVLLVYQGGRHPVSLVAHGYGERTWLYLVDTPQQRADPCLEAAIIKLLSA